MTIFQYLMDAVQKKVLVVDGLFAVRLFIPKLESKCMSIGVLVVRILVEIGVNLSFLLIRRFYFILDYIKG